MRFLLRLKETRLAVAGSAATHRPHHPLRAGDSSYAYAGCEDGTHSVPIPLARAFIQLTSYDIQTLLDRYGTGRTVGKLDIYIHIRYLLLIRRVPYYYSRCIGGLLPPK